MGLAFPAGGTGGMGSGGGGFGVPAGGLGAFSGLVPFDRLGDVDGYAKNAWLDKHGQTEVDDLTIAITSAASFGTAGPLSALATRGAGGAAARGGATSAAHGGSAAGGGARAGAGRAGAGATDDAARASNKARTIEKAGEGAGLAGVPTGGELGKIVAHLSLYPALRLAVQAEVRHYRAQIAAAVAAGTLSRAVRKGLTDEAIARLKGLSGVP